MTAMNHAATNRRNERVATVTDSWAPLRNLMMRWWSGSTPLDVTHLAERAPDAVSGVQAAEFDTNDPLVAWLTAHGSAAQVSELMLDSDLLRSLRQEGVEMIAPLLNNGQMVGLLTLDARRSQQPYSTVDRRLLTTLADEVAPSLHVARLVEAQQRQALEHERMEQEMRLAHEIQLSLLPRTLPAIPGWHLETKYQPARAVGGDFFDLIQLDERRLGVLIGDVTGKGMPAALIMANSRSILRSIADSGAPPAQVLQRANNLLLRDITPGFFVTCLYAVIDTVTGHVVMANAGHNPPFQRIPALEEMGKIVAPLRVEKMDAVGLPLGLMGDTTYEESEGTVQPGSCVLFYSDGITEAHSPQRTLFGFDRLKALMETLDPNDCPSVLDALLGALSAFTGRQAEQEDDITLLALHRL
jgi:serine phosphatase RsbU (regulator of sigma subunit)